MKRLIALLTVLVALVPAFAAAQAGSVRVTAERTSIRDKADTAGAVVASVSRGDVLTVIETAGPWFKVRTSAGREGYVHSLFVERVAGGAAPAAAPMPAPAPTPAPAAAPAPRAPEPSSASSSSSSGSSSGSSSQGGAPSIGAAQFGVGLSLLGDGGGAGVIADYSKAIKEQGDSRTLGWVGDFSFHHKGYGSIYADYSVTQILVQGGVRLAGVAGEKVNWHAQGLVGIDRVSVGGDSAFCNLGACSASDTSLIFTIGGAFQYALSERRGVRAQLDIPINDNGSTTRFSLMYVMKMGE